MLDMETILKGPNCFFKASIDSLRGCSFPGDVSVASLALVFYAILLNLPSDSMIPGCMFLRKWKSMFLKLTILNFSTLAGVMA